MNPLETPAGCEPASRAALGTEQLIAMVVQYYWAVYDEAMNAFRLSQQDKQVRTIEESDDGAKKRDSIRTENRPGTPAFLAKALEALKAIRQLLGLDARWRKHAPDEPDESDSARPTTKEDLCNMTDKQLLNTVARQFEGAGGDDAASPGSVEKEQEPPLVHEVPPAGPLDEQTVPAPGVADGPDGGGPVPETNGLATGLARQVQSDAGLPAGLPQSAAQRQQTPTPAGCEPQPGQAADHEQRYPRVDPVDPHEVRALRAVTGNGPMYGGSQHKCTVPGKRSKWKAARRHEKRYDREYMAPDAYAK